VHYYKSRSRACDECVRGATPIDETHLPDKTWMHSTSYRWASSWYIRPKYSRRTRARINCESTTRTCCSSSLSARWILSPEERRCLRQLQFLRRSDRSKAEFTTTTVATLRPSVDLLSTTQYYTRVLTQRTDTNGPSTPTTSSAYSEPRVDTLTQLQRTQNNDMDLQQALDRTDPSPPTTRP
jgi:hypothetical protein